MRCAVVLLRCCVGVIDRTSSCILALFFAIEGVVLGCSGNDEGVVKGTRVSRGLITLGKDIVVTIVVAATSWRRASCVI